MLENVAQNNVLAENAALPNGVVAPSASPSAVSSASEGSSAAGLDPNQAPWSAEAVLHPERGTKDGQMDGQCQLSNVAAALGAVDELAACREANGMLRLAIELARGRLGLERVGLFMRDRGCDRILMRGTWGTGARGEITDERGLFHEFAPREYHALLGSRLSGGFGQYRPHAQLFATEPGRTMVIGEGWVMATPLVAARDVVGVMYNDAALSHSPVDDGKQAAAAVFCTLLAVLYQSRRGGISWQPLPRKSGQGPLVERVLRALGEDLPVTGERLATELGVSPGHLARSFKREMGVSLVDYRNRLRLDRFFEAIHRRGGSGNLLDAALEAGFGSYAQFHRVYRKFLGTTPRDVFTSGHATSGHATSGHATSLPAGAPANGHSYGLGSGFGAAESKSSGFEV
jgi:AraC-like DNA-binding protein